MHGGFAAWPEDRRRNPAGRLSLIAALNAFAISVAFWPGLAGPATSPRWAIAALSLYHLHWTCAPFLVWCFLRLDFDSAVHWAIICAAFSWGLKSDQRQQRWCIIAFASGIAISGVVAIAQGLFGYEGIPQLASPGGLFLNKNFMGECAALAIIAAVSAGLRWWPWGLIAMPALLLSESRAAWLAAGVGIFFLASTRQKIVLVIGACLIGIVLWSYGYGYTYTLGQRFMLWNIAIENLSWFGSGPFDYSTVEHREPNLHNDWLQLIYELGIFGLIPIAVVLVASFEDLAFVAALVVLGSFGFPFHSPASAWFVAFVVGSLVGRHLVERRVVLRSRMAASQLS